MLVVTDQCDSREATQSQRDKSTIFTDIHIQFQPRQYAPTDGQTQWEQRGTIQSVLWMYLYDIESSQWTDAAKTTFSAIS